MKNPLSLCLAIALVIGPVLGCSDDTGTAPILPPGPSLDSGSEDGEDSDVSNPPDTAEDITSTDDTLIPEDIANVEDVDPGTDGTGVEDTSGSEDAEEANDGQDDDSTWTDPDVINTDDTGENEGDGGEIHNPDATEGGGEDGEGGAEDIEEPEEDTGPPPECTDDSECTFLTALACCPGPLDPCINPPESGLYEEELEVIAWLSDTCDPSLSCPDFTAPECSQCHNVYSFEATCDAVLGECATTGTLNCGALCAAGGQAVEETCPGISDPDALTLENLEACDCP